MNRREELNMYDLEENELAFVMHNRGYCGEGCDYCKAEYYLGRWQEEEFEENIYGPA
jgi:hypothetical protein